HLWKVSTTPNLVENDVVSTDSSERIGSWPRAMMTSAPTTNAMATEATYGSTFQLGVGTRFVLFSRGSGDGSGVYAGAVWSTVSFVPFVSWRCCDRRCWWPTVCRD